MYLLEVVKSGHGEKFRAVAGQKFPNGEKVDPNSNVQGEVDLRKGIGIGGLVITDELTDRKRFYTLRKVFAINETQAKKLDIPLAPPEGLDIFRVYTKTGSTSKNPEVSEITKNSLLFKLMKDSSLTPPTLEDNGFYIEKNKWYLFLRNVKRTKNTMIKGPAGVGKTELVELVAEKMDLPYNTFDMGSLLDPTSGLVGVHRLKDKESTFDYARFAKTIQEPGIILLDELSRAPENTTNLLLPVLDSRRTLYADAASSDIDREIKVHPDCIFMATANIGVEYTGTNLLDKALVSRFFEVVIDYPESGVETAILTERTEVDEDDAKAIVKLCNLIRQRCAEGILSKDVSVRESLEIGEMISDGYPVGQAMRLVLFPIFEGGEQEGGERHTINGLISGI